MFNNSRATALPTQVWAHKEGKEQRLSAPQIGEAFKAKPEYICLHADKPGQNYSLVVDGADHYLGNLICRPEREEQPQHKALRVINTASVAFLDWQLKGGEPLDSAAENSRNKTAAEYGQR